MVVRSAKSKAISEGARATLIGSHYSNVNIVDLFHTTSLEVEPQRYLISKNVHLPLQHNIICLG